MLTVDTPERPERPETQEETQPLSVVEQTKALLSSPEIVQRWLEGKDVGPVGYAHSAHGCPLAMFLAEKTHTWTAVCGHDALVPIAEVEGWACTMRVPLPEWAQKFVHAIDRTHARRETPVTAISRERALEVLRAVS